MFSASRDLHIFSLWRFRENAQARLAHLDGRLGRRGESFGARQFRLRCRYSAFEMMPCSAICLLRPNSV
jgi:hypothetical protein